MLPGETPPFTLAAHSFAKIDATMTTPPLPTADLEVAYSVFASVPLPRNLHGSPLRDVDKILRDITSAPLRQLTADQLGEFATSAITTLGEVEHYRHFLPRILELAIHGGLDPGFEAGVIAGKLELAGWRSWPSDERQAVEAVFRAAFRRAIEMDTDEEREADEWLCGLCRLGLDPAPSLAAWRASPSVNAALQLAVFVDEMKVKDGLVANGTWRDIDEAARRTVAAWALSEETFAQLLAAVDAAASAGPASGQGPWLIEIAVGKLP